MAFSDLINREASLFSGVKKRKGFLSPSLVSLSARKISFHIRIEKIQLSKKGAEGGRGCCSSRLKELPGKPRPVFPAAASSYSAKCNNVVVVARKKGKFAHAEFARPSFYFHCLPLARNLNL